MSRISIQRFMKCGISASLSLILISCGDQVSTEANTATALPDDGTATSASVQHISEADRGRVCRATLAAEMGRPVETISVVKTTDEYVRVSYIREDDGVRWSNECKFNGNRVIWRTFDASGPGSGVGPWRERPDDPLLYFSISGNVVTVKIRWTDGSQLEKSFQT